ncbi:hypothetical protein SPBR_03218 [Sporothrix brasiliensis 5110]|uniref:Clr5 domain-containing protein n=1 Tax=Sporothrix brasiliensis 5110 TaxID=1398154 RepID=A0A0C2FP84_9PEZI|nr:uncharacterized protein SPBR_03218 [Sporothrix brasiliensis 5110]KIH92873.1 hypothetical protein SPBR_03218 [Sporothrix brasiliensis 5110]
MFRPEKAEDWEEFRDVITVLYQNNTLSEVIVQMKTLHFFSATPKQYKTKFKEWGLTTKYVKGTEYEELLEQEEQDEYNVRGKRVSHQDVARFKRRREKSESKAKGGSSGKSSSSSKGGSASSASGMDTGYEYEYYDTSGEGGGGGAYMISSGDYMAYTTSGAAGGGGGTYITADGTPVTTATDYGAYAYDTSGGAAQGYDPNLEGGYQQQGYGE